jgi:hypothetical protein
LFFETSTKSLFLPFVCESRALVTSNKLFVMSHNNLAELGFFEKAILFIWLL